MIWWIADPDRGLAERSAIARLEQSADWLQNVAWRLDGLALLLDFEIAEGGLRWRLTMRYPDFFPSIPPQVFNADGTRLSGHQYGADGELCLEYRPDNWEQSVTGAMMIESAHRLLVGESPALDGPGVASAHRVTEGQRLRGTVFRLAIPDDALSLLREMGAWQTAPVEVDEHFYGGAFIAHLTAVGPEEARLWQRTKPVASANNLKGTAIRMPPDTIVPGPVDKDLLSPILSAAGLSTDYPDWPPAVYLLVDEKKAWLAMVANKPDGGIRDYSYDSFVIEPDRQRLPDGNAVLAGKRIGLVGCGSLGSKIAAMLVRSGARQFELFDDDLFAPGNLVRNELDWRSVGTHKARALRARLTEIEPDVKVAVQVVHLGGQESSQWTSTALEALSNCDIILDASADPTVFGLCAAAARFKGRPMAWAEVFGGGIGGIVARSRPEHDPSPDISRRQILKWCEDHGVEWQSALNAIDYGIARGDQPPLIADDADVSVIAAHAARLVIDTLRGGGTQFPSPAYAIGLGEGWIFRAPFDTYPINYTGTEGWNKPSPSDGKKLEKLVGLLFPG